MRRSLWAKALVVLLVWGLVTVPFNVTVRGQGQSQSSGLRGMQGSGLPGISRQASDISAAPSTLGQVRAAPIRYPVDVATLQTLKANPPSLPGRKPVFVQDRSLLGKVAQPSAPASSAPSLVKSFEGIGFTGFIPPDNGTGGGLNHVGQVVNSTAEIFQKTGTPALGPADLCGPTGIWSSTLFPPGVTPQCGDPRGVYDLNSNRWVLSATAFSVSPQGSWYLLATSKTSDPTAGFCTWALDATLDGTTPTNNEADFPVLGIDNQAIYLTSNQFDFTTGAFQGAKVRILGQAQLYSNTCAAPSWVDFVKLTNPDTTLADGVEPAQTYGTPGVEYLMNARFAGGSDVTLWSLTNPLSSPVLSRVSVPVGTYGLPPSASQCTGATPIDTGDARLQQVVYRNGVLWTAHTVASGSDSHLRFLGINPSGPTVLDDFTFGFAGFFYYYPAVTVDGSGNIYAVFNRSSPTECVGIHYTGRPRADPTNTMQQSVLLRGGDSSYALLDSFGRNRWGDYSSSSPDPLNSKAVWLGGEYATTPTGLCILFGLTSCWATKIAQVHFDVDTIGLYNPTTSTFYLRNSNTSGFAELTVNYGPANMGWIPVLGDWNGTGTEKVGLYNPATSTFYLRNSNTSGSADVTFDFGPAGRGWTPIVGDWGGTNSDMVGLYNPTTSTFYLRFTNTSGFADLTFAFGPANMGWIPIVGDWNATGMDKVGLYNPLTSTFYLRNSLTSGFADLTFGYGPGGMGWIPRRGDWSVDGF